MKVAFVVNNEVYTPRVMEMLQGLGVDFFTQWEKVKGKGHGTEPHLGTRSFPGLNSVLMIAFEDENLLAKVIEEITLANKQIHRSDDRIRLFQVPLERIV
jgi:hypothetical protein